MTIDVDIPPLAPPKPKLARPRFTSARSIGALILREMNTTYGRSPLGYMWMILQPVAGIGLLVAIFSAGFRNPPLGRNFAIFYATGMLPFLMFTDLAGKLGQALNYSKQFMAYPRITFMDAILARFILNVLTNLLVSYILITAILMIYETRTTLDFRRIGLAYAMAASFGFGFGTMNCLLISTSNFWQQVWGISNRPLVLVSGVIFLYDNIPEQFRPYFWWNPLMHVTGEMRGAFYLSYDASYVSPGYVFSVSAVLALLGLLFLRRFHRRILFD